MIHVQCRTGDVELMAVVRNRIEVEGSRRFGLTFVSSPMLGAQLSAGLLRIVNYRQAMRVEPAGPIPVHLQIPDQGCGTSGRLRDISAGGMAVVIDPAFERLLARVVEVTWSSGCRVMTAASPCSARSAIDASWMTSPGSVWACASIG